MKYVRYLLSVLFLSFIFMSKWVNAFPTCIGINYEQKQLSADILPTLKLDSHSFPLEVKSGESMLLIAKANIDSKGKAFFRWCANEGIFEPVSSVTDYSQVKFIVPVNPIKEEIWLEVLLGDSLGHIDRLETTIKVSSEDSFSGNLQTGEVTISPVPDELNVPGLVQINGQSIEANWTSNEITFNLYDSTHTNLDTFHQPVYLELQDADGKKIYSVCFPFKDVCSYRWYSSPTIKLWRENVVQGYEAGKAGIYYPDYSSLRAEFIVAVVRALKVENQLPTLVESTFWDVNANDWFAPSVHYAKEQGFINGCDELGFLFCPSEPISRAEAMKIIALAFPRLANALAACKSGQLTSNFSDLDNNAWYAPYLCAAEAEHVINGYKDGTFRPNQSMTRAEMAKVICIAAFGPMECIADIVAKTPVDTTEPDDEADGNLPDESDTDGSDDSGDTTPDDGEAGTGDDDGSDTDSSDNSDDTTPDDGETGTGDADELADDLDPDDNKPGDETAALRLKDGSIATNCTFSDITDDNQWFVVPVKAFCSAGIIIGYSESGKRVYKPTQEANLVETLKVLLYASDYERIGEQSVGSDPWYKFFLNDAKDKGLSVDETKIGEPVTRLLALTYLAKLFYGYTGSSPVPFLVGKDITSGTDPERNLNRAELVTLAYRAANDADKDIHYGLVDSPPDAEPDTSSDYGQAVANKANDKVGVKFPYVDKKYTYCARFARSMHGKPAKWPDAKGMCNYFQGKGLMKTDGEPTEGAVVCYLPGPSNWNYGHVAIAVGDNKEVGATSLRYGVTKRDIRFGAGYQGWVTADDYNNNYPQ
ncbi:MAG: hypothetical protein DRQ49_14625 [Gammaproteobacteria bacterium]|nr:MAG: hypothetical protein DRQ49_14625 [Gammaproteobacteria bacterium]